MTVMTKLPTPQHTDGARDQYPSPYAQCLLTISDDGFVAGTEMLLFSFLRSNRWFRGEIVVLADHTLSEDSRTRLRAIAPIQFLAPRADLCQRVATLAEALPALRAAAPRFASLEAFGMTGYERVVYIDSDAIVTGDIAPLFFDQRPLLACPDGSHYDALLGDASAARESNRRRYGLPLDHCFNTGVFALSGEMLDTSLRDRLIADIDPATWSAVETLGWTDQLILNRRFAGRAELLDGRYNYMPILEAKIRQAHALNFYDAKIVHMAGRYKPWETLPPDLLAQAPSLAKFHELWQQLAALLPRADIDATTPCTTNEIAALHDAMRPRTELETLP